MCIGDSLVRYSYDQYFKDTLLIYEANYPLLSGLFRGLWSYSLRVLIWLQWQIALLKFFWHFQFCSWYQSRPLGKLFGLYSRGLAATVLSQEPILWKMLENQSFWPHFQVIITRSILMLLTWNFVHMPLYKCTWGWHIHILDELTFIIKSCCQVLRTFGGPKWGGPAPYSYTLLPIFW